MSVALITALIFVFVLLLLLAVSLGLTQSKEEKKRHEVLNKIPGPKTRPLVGSLAAMPRTQQELLPWFSEKLRQYNGLFLMKFGTKPVVIMSKNEYAAEVLRGSKHSEKSQFYESLHEWLGLGLLTSGGLKWKSRRRMITPAFHFDILDQILGRMIKHTNVAIEKFESFAERETEVDIWQELSLLALDIISDSAMGVELEAQLRNPDSLEYVANRDKVAFLIANRFRSVWLYGDIIYYNFIPDGRKERKLVKKMHEFTEKVILQRWKELQQNFQQFLNRKKNSFLDLLLLGQRDNNLTFDDIREEVDTFMFEGHDTTTASMSFVLQILASYPEVMSKLQEEVDEKLGQVVISPDNVNQVKKALLTMPYLDAVLKESLRLFPSVPAILREMKEDIAINGYKIPNGSDISISLVALHRDPEVYPDPLAFKPERWLNKQVPLDEKPFCFIPFSAGPRNCIGQRFALMEERLIVASIAKNFNLTSDTPMDNLQVYGQLILRPLQKFHIHFSRRIDVSNP